MPRKFFNDGEEVVYGDLLAISSVLEIELYNRVIYELMRRQQNVVFGDSFTVNYTNSTTLSVIAGNGVQYDNTQVDPEPTTRLLYLPNAVAKTITTPDATNNRIDIISIRANRATLTTQSRNIKSAIDGTVSSVSSVTETDWLSDVLVTAGTPSVSPAIPSTPAGYIKLCEILVTAVTGIASQSAITDKRPRYQRGGVKVVTKTTAYTIDLDDNTVLANAAGGGFSVTLPKAADAWDSTNLIAREYTIVNIGASNTVTIQANGAETIDGSNTQAMASQYTSLTVYSDGSQWWIR